MEIGTKTFAELVEDQKTHFGMVITGAGQPYQEWVDGISELLYGEGITKEHNCFDLAYTLSDNVKGQEGRTNLVIFFSETAKPEVGKLAIWRLKFGSCMWTEDFVDNHSNEFKSGHRSFAQDRADDERDFLEDHDETRTVN
jgi:hypothetical protein